MKRLLPRVRALFSLGIAILGSGVILWLVTTTLTRRAWKASFLAHMAKTAHVAAATSKIPPEGKWVITHSDGLWVCRVNLDKGRWAMDEALSALHLSPAVAAEILFQGKGAAICLDPKCKTIVSGARMKDPANSRQGAVIVMQKNTILYNLLGFTSMVWMLALVLVGVTAFLLGYFLLYLWQVKPFLELVGEIERVEPLLKDVSGPRRPGSPLEVLIRLRKAYEEEKIKRRRLEHQVHEMRSNLLTAQDSLVRSEKLASVGLLAAGLAHEIGNPVGIIMGLAEILASDDTSPEDAREYAKAIQNSARRVHHVIKDLLIFARPAKEEGERAEVNSVVKDAVGLMQPQSSFKNIVLQTRLMDRPVYAEIKPSHLQQVIVNLMLNAADAMNGRGIIDIKVSVNEGRVAIAILDSGPGIPKEILSRIWEPFFTTKDVGKGTGLGLPMSLRIVNAYGGDIHVETATGKGTIFTIYLWEVD